MANGNFVPNLTNFIGQTVTVFTTSGGQSGRGFTGVLALVTPNFIRLITQIGPAPGCALGNCCEKERHRPERVAGEDICVDGVGNYPGNIGGQGNYPGNIGGQGNYPGNIEGQGNYPGNIEGEEYNRSIRGRIDCNANRGLGSVVDIPVDKIASFVHNAVGGSW